MIVGEGEHMEPIERQVKVALLDSNWGFASTQTTTPSLGSKSQNSFFVVPDFQSSISWV